VTSATSILPDRFDPRVARLFTWYARRLIRRRFHAFSVLRSDLAALEALDAHPGPAMALMNHPSWWDPLVGVVLADRFTPSRRPSAPMDVEQLRRFGFFRRLGLFGIDPQDPRGAEAMVDHVLTLFQSATRPTLWITPQGRFTDAREPIRLRAGSALVAASCANPAVVAVAVEYVFWQDQRPEILVAAERVDLTEEAQRGDGIARPSRRRLALRWHRAMETGMASAARRLARAAIGRDPALFHTLIGGASGRINPIYDLWLRLRGRQGAIVAGRPEVRRHHEASPGAPRRVEADSGRDVIPVMGGDGLAAGDARALRPLPNNGVSP